MIRHDRPAPIACDLSAIGPAERAAHIARSERLLSHLAQEVAELPDGYAVRFAADDYQEVAAFIANERLCCPFFTFTLEVGAGRGPLWLRLTGGEEVKTYLRTMLGRG
jgi:hypothetical protein